MKAPAGSVGHRPTWLDAYVAAVLAAACLAAWLLTQGFRDHAASIPWYFVAVGLGLAEVGVVHLHIARSAHSFTVSEFVVVLGLVAASPSGLLAAAVMGPAVALIATRQLSPRKLVFNVSQYVLVMSMAIAVYGEVGPGPNWTDVRTWVAAASATCVASMVSSALIALAIQLSDGPGVGATLRQSIVPSQLVTMTNTTIGLMVLCLVQSNPVALILLAPPIGLVLGAYRTYASLRTQSEGLALLHGSVIDLNVEPDLDVALRGLLERSASAFHADFTEILFSPDSSTTPFHRFVYADGDLFESEMRVEDLRALLDLMECSGSGVTKVHSTDHTVGPHVRSLGAERAMVAELRSDNRVLGVLLVGHRADSQLRYGAEQLRLLQSLAGHVASTLQNDRLELAYMELHRLQGSLQYQASHDPLTELVNRRALVEELERVSTASEEAFALLYLDLDDFKPVNDLLGHEAGDEVLIEVARRMKTVAGPKDVVARLGGDEFVVLMPSGAERSATEVARRIREAIETPMTAGGTTVRLGATVGVFVSGATTVTPYEALHAADQAMYARKSERKAQSATTTDWRDRGLAGAA